MKTIIVWFFLGKVLLQTGYTAVQPVASFGPYPTLESCKVAQKETFALPPPGPVYAPIYGQIDDFPNCFPVKQKK